MTDLEIIHELEEQIGSELPLVNGDIFTRIDEFSSQHIRGYCVDETEQVTQISLSLNSLEEVSPLLKRLHKLQALDLSGSLISDYSSLKTLNQLQALYLIEIEDQINDISFLTELPQLHTLYLDGNQISDISPLSTLTQLKNLSLSRNQITDISPLSNLTQLQNIYLGQNQIEDISALQKLSQLQRVNLSRNNINRLPGWIVRLGPEITTSQYGTGINLYDNPSVPPREILGRGEEAIHAYYRSLEKEKTVQFNEVKLLVVGGPMAGKTSLIKRMQSLPFDENESQTHGINIVTLHSEKVNWLQEINGFTDYRLHCWDFGGQEIMHTSHQFFLNERALYILLLDSRTNAEKYYWLNHIEKFGGQSPIIVVMNKIDDNMGYNIQQRSINERFPNIQNRFHRISCRTDEGLSALFETIVNTIPKTSLFGTEISVAWMRIKEQLVAETQAQRYISRDTFVGICQQHGVEDSGDQQTLLQLLHDLGIVLYFTNLSLADIYVLDPHWVTIGVYKIINSQEISNGKLDVDALDYILNLEETESHNYEPAQDNEIIYSIKEWRYILKIMERFELLYCLDGDEKIYILPDLLPTELPAEPELEDVDDTLLRFVMKYDDYVPKPILPRLMIDRKNDIVEDQQWRYGMLLESCDLGCRAKVRLDEERKTIEIMVQGEPRRKRYYFMIIRDALLEINEALDVKPDELIPLPGYPDYMVEYEELMGYEEAGIDDYFAGKLRKSFSVSALLDSVIERGRRLVIEGGVHHHTHVGNIEDSAGVAVGAGAEATAIENEMAT